MNKKNIAKLSGIGVILLAFTGSTAASDSAVADFSVQKTQNLNFEKHFNVIETSISVKKFSRGDYKIVTTQPWKKPEVASKRLSDRELIDILKSVGFSGQGLRMAWAIVQKESSSRPYAHNDNPATGDNSYGLFQINMFKSLEASRLKKYDLENNEELFDPITNAKIAYQISNGGKNWSAWTTFDTASKIVSSFPG